MGIVLGKERVGKIKMQRDQKIDISFFVSLKFKC